MEHNGIKKVCKCCESNDANVSTDISPDDTQITIKDTGWSEEEKESMKALGYDSLDMVRAWYS